MSAPERTDERRQAARQIEYERAAAADEALRQLVYRETRARLHGHSAVDECQYCAEADTR